MAISSSRAFQRAAGQRLTTAEFLRDNGNYNVDAMYLGGYAMECSLKALILHRTPPAKREETFKKIAKGSKMHVPAVLKQELRRLGCEIPTRLLSHIDKSPWSPDLRYESGRGDAVKTSEFLKA